MKKIMFIDRFRLTKAVIEGRKWMTRRIIPKKVLSGAYDYVQKVHGTGHDWLDYVLEHSPYKYGEVVAVAQCYKDVFQTDGLPHPLVASPGWTNKMFVKAMYMPNKIRISKVRVERLRDISDEDCIKEGIRKKNGFPHKKSFPFYFDGGNHEWDNSFSTPRGAFAALIDKISGKGTWGGNPWMYVYEFELVK